MILYINTYFNSYNNFLIYLVVAINKILIPLPHVQIVKILHNVQPIWKSLVISEITATGWIGKLI